MVKNNFDNIFNNPYVKPDDVSDKKEVVTHNVSSKEKNNTNTTIFQAKSKKTKKMLYLTEDNIKKLEDIAKKYDRSVSDIINLIIEHQEY